MRGATHDSGRVATAGGDVGAGSKLISRAVKLCLGSKECVLNNDLSCTTKKFFTVLI
jgi:hypothetical protein